MMRLSTLWSVDRTLDADGRSPLADRIAEQWEHDANTVRFVRSSANFVYRFSANGSERFLRFARNAERTRETIEGEIELLEWLAERGVSVARPVRSRSGNRIETIETSLGTFHAVAFERLLGRHRELGEMDAGCFHAWGAALGRLHAAMADYAGPALATRPSWRDHLDQARRYIPSDKATIRRELDEIAVAIEALPADRECCGLIHGDFELDNLVWPDQGNGTPGILDFDDGSRHWYAADLAFALRDLFDRGADPSDPSVGAFVRGYRAHFPLNDELLAAVPLFSRLSRLLTCTRLARSLDLPDRSDQPAWLRRLRGKFEARIATYVATLA